MISAEQAKMMLRTATPGPWELYDANEGMDPPRPLWSVANEEFHNTSANEDEPWVAVNVQVDTGVLGDARLIAAAPELAQAVINLHAEVDAFDHERAGLLKRVDDLKRQHDVELADLVARVGRAEAKLARVEALMRDPYRVEAFDTYFAVDVEDLREALKDDPS